MMFLFLQASDLDDLHYICCTFKYVQLYKHSVVGIKERFILRILFERQAASF
jgi:hypothetical protein